jgi:hypothetical protein
MNISKSSNPYGLLVTYDSDSGDDEWRSLDSMDEKVAHLAQVSLSFKSRDFEGPPLYLTIPGDLRNFTFLEKASNREVFLKLNTLFPLDYHKPRELFTSQFESTCANLSINNWLDSNYFLLKQILKDSQMATLPTSFYRHSYFLLHGWVERFLKKSFPDCLDHDLVKLLNQAYKQNNMTYRQYISLVKLFQVYRYFLRLDNDENKLLPKVLLLNHGCTSKEIYDEFIDDIQLVVQGLASLSGDFNLVRNKVFESVVPSYAYPCSKSRLTADYYALIDELETLLKNNWTDSNFNVDVLKGESSEDVLERKKRYLMHQDKINYQLFELKDLLEYFEAMDYEDEDSVSLPLIHHLMYKVSILLESSILLFITYNPIKMDENAKKHIIFSISEKATKERLLGYEHNIFTLLNVLKKPYRFKIPRDELEKISNFNNFSNGASRYPDRAKGNFAKIWLDLISFESNPDKSHVTKVNQHLKTIKECINAAIKTSLMVIKSHCNA